MVKPYMERREETRERDRSLREKVVTLEEAASFVHDGEHVALGGCTMSRTPIALLWSLIRAGRRDLTVSRSIVSTEGDLLYASGASRHIITSWFSQGIVWGISKVMRNFTESGRARFEEWSHMSIGLRYRAGAMGVPFLPTRSMLGSGVREVIGEGAREMDCPFTGERLLLLPALEPDVALIHVQRADAYGNAQLDGLQFMDIDIAMAAKRVILSAERIVSNDQIRRAPDQTKIPFFTVDAVVEVPFGSAPHECYGTYEPFFNHMDEYANACYARDGDAEAAVADYLRRYYHEPSSWSDYLALLGMGEVLDAARRGRSIYND